MPETVPTVDGVPIDQIIKMEEGVYQRFEAVSERELKSRRRFTAFVTFGQGVCTEIEEIDVMATDHTDAQTIVELALMWHYHDGNVGIQIQEWPEGVTLHHFF